MAIRTGQQYLQGLKDRPREVWVRGQRVDVTTHPAFVRPLAHTAGLYDLQHDPRCQDVMTFICPDTGERAATAFMSCTTTEDLKKRAEAYRLMAEPTLGMMGRSPDFLNGFIHGFAESAELLAEPIGKRYADNLRNYRDHVRDNDLFLTHALVTPQIDRARLSGEQADEFLHLGVVRETPDGLIVRGARMLATMGPIADEVVVYSMGGQKVEDSNYVFMFALPIDAKGIRQICREPYDDGDRLPGNHPLAANFEDSDTLILFKDVLVPWDRVFAWNNVPAINNFAAKNTGRMHSSHQAAVRGLVKFEFVVGLLMQVAKANGAEKFLHVQHMIGECLHYVELMKGCLVRAIVEARPGPGGPLAPAMLPLTTARMLTARQYSRVVEILQIVGAGGMQMMPSVEDFDSPIAADIERYYQGAAGMSAKERVGLYKMAWDVCGDAFGQRQVQYERYHQGDPVRLLANLFLSYDKTNPERLVRLAFAATGTEIPVQSALPGAAPGAAPGSAMTA